MKEKLKIKTKVKETNWGIACRIGNTIYLNKHLKKYPELYKAILKHEEDHTSRFKLKDILLDLKQKDWKRIDYYKFMLNHPKTFVQYFPFWIYEGQFVIDPLMLGGWVLLLLEIFIIIGVRL